MLAQASSTHCAVALYNLLGPLFAWTGLIIELSRRLKYVVMTNITCPWTLFNDREKDEVDLALDLTGTITCMLTLWFILAYFFTRLKENASYKNIAVLLASAWIRRATTITVNNFFINKKSEFWKDTSIFEIFAFVETFMAVHEVECLTHVCIERFVVSKYICNDWTMPKKHYVLFRRLCLFFASVYSLVPALGLGGFGFDFTCSSYTMDMILPKTRWREYVAVSVFILRSIKPVGFMIFMLAGCQIYGLKFSNSEYNRFQRLISLDAVVVTFINLAFWAPIAMIRGKVVLKQPEYGTEMLILPSKSYVKLAMLLHWNSLLPTVIALFLLDRNIRDATLKLRFRDIVGKSVTSKDE